MNDTLKTIHDIDLTFLAVEKARLAVEAAKNSLELAKQEAEAARQRFEESLVKAEELGLPRAKLRKVAEERVGVLLMSGLLKEDTTPTEKAAPRVIKKNPRRAKAAPAESVAGTNTDSDVDDNPHGLSESDWRAGKEKTEISAEA